MTRCDFNCVVQRLEIDIYFSCVFLRRFVEMHSLYLHIVQHCHYEVKKNFKYFFFFISMKVLMVRDNCQNDVKF